MPFGTVPILHGRFFTYRAYFALLAAVGIIYAVIVCCLLGLWIRTRAYRKIAQSAGADDASESLVQAEGEGQSERKSLEVSGTGEVGDESPTGLGVQLSQTSQNRDDAGASAVDAAAVIVLGDSVASKPRATACAGICIYVFVLIAGVLLAAVFIGCGLADVTFVFALVASIFFVVPAVVVAGFFPNSLGTGRPFFSVALYLMSFLVIQFMWFGFLPEAVGIILGIFPLFWGLWLAIQFDHPPSFVGEAAIWKRAVLVGVIAVAISSLLGVCGAGVCLDIYQEHVPGFVTVEAVGFSLSAHWSRHTFQCKPLWKEDAEAPCHLYLTVPEDASTSVFVNMHFPKGSEAVTVYAIPVSEQESSAASAFAKASRFEMGMLGKGNRDVNSALLTGLTPSTLYRLEVQLGARNLTMPAATPWRFQTAPGPEHATTLAMCGDMGTYAEVAKLLRLAGAEPTAPDAPDAFVIGGDIAYDNGMPTCYCAWDSWLGFYGEAASSTGFLIPFVLVVGNHDTGTEAVQFATPPKVNKGQLPFFTFFPHHSEGVGPNGEAGVPGLDDRAVEHVHRVGNTLVLVLDSGYVDVSDWGSSQLKWAEGVLAADEGSATPAQVKIASYHVPIYPSTKVHHDDWGAGPSGAFVRLFDENGVLFAMENHVHAHKRTVPMRDSTPHANGTIYFGDGRAGPSGLGVPKQEDLITMAEEPLRLAVESQAINHIWRVSVTSEHISFVAIDTEGVEIDACNRTLEPVAKRMPLVARGQEEALVLQEM